MPPKDYLIQLQNTSNSLRKALASSLLEKQNIIKVIDAMSQLIDANLLADAFDLASAAKTHFVRFPEANTYFTHDARFVAEYFCVYEIHIDLSRKRRMEEHEKTLNTLICHSNLWVMANALSARGMIAIHNADFLAAEAYFKKSVAKFLEVNDTVGSQKVEIRYLYALMYQSKFTEAQSYGQELLPVWRQAGNASLYNLIALYGFLGHCSSYLGINNTQYLRDAAKLSRKPIQNMCTAFAQYQYGFSMCRLKRWHDAVGWLRSAEETSRSCDPVCRQGAMMLLTRAYRETEQWELALRTASEISNTRFLTLHIEDVIEAAEELFTLAFLLYDVDAAAKYLLWLRDIKFTDADEAKQLEDFLVINEKRLLDIKTRLQTATSIKPTLSNNVSFDSLPLGQIFLDKLNQQIVCKRPFPFSTLFRFKDNTGLIFIVNCLLEQALSGDTSGFTKMDLVHKLSAQTEEESRTAGLLQRIGRAVSTGEERGIFSTVILADKSKRVVFNTREFLVVL